MAVTYWVKTAAAIAFAAIMLIYSLNFFSYGIEYLRTNEVFSGIVAVAVGFALLSASVTLLRDWVLAAKAEKAGREAPQASSSSS